MTNISIIKSTVELTIDDLSGVNLNQPFINVTGTINVNDHTVWVNGVKATLNGDGTWTAENVPVNEGGTAVIEAVAISNTDNGGNGTGGSGGSGGGGGGGTSSNSNSGNPASPSSKGTQANPEKPAFVYVETYREDWGLDLTDCDPIPRDKFKHSDVSPMDWRIGAGGSRKEEFEVEPLPAPLVGPNHYKRVTTWPGDWFWPPQKAGTMVSSDRSFAAEKVFTTWKNLDKCACPAQNFI